MSWDSTNHRMSGAVGNGDISAALNVGGPPYPMGNMVVDSPTINKWAKWKPLSSPALNLPTRDSRRAAGRPVSTDITYQFGVHASGFGMNVYLDDIHACNFEYVAPVAGTDIFRNLDLVDPESSSYGYRSDAYFDFRGKIWNLGEQNLVIPTSGYRDSLEITYSPHNAATWAEMLSVRDFLTSETSSPTTIDPNDMYPCAIITQDGYHFIHCLYTSTGNALATLRNASGYWRLPMDGCPFGNNTGQLHQNQPAVISLFLSSGRYLLGPNTNTDISTWIAKAAGTSGDLWVSWFCPVPEACGEVCYIGQASTGIIVLIQSAEYNSPHTVINVSCAVDNAADSNDFAIVGQCDTSSTITQNLIVRSGMTTAGAAFFVSAFRNAGATIVPGIANTFRFWVTKNGVATGSEITVTLTN